MTTAVLAVAPAADFADPGCGVLGATEFSIKFHLGPGELVESVMLHVRGGRAGIAVITKLPARLGARAIDMQTGDFFEASRAVEVKPRGRHSASR